MEKTIGFVGLGQMGAALAERLLAKEREMFVYDPRSTAVAALQAKGGKPARNLADLAAACDIVVCCLPEDKITLKVASELAVGGRVRLVIETSTVGRPCLEEMERVLSPANIALIDAPVSGGPRGARSGRTSMMAAGSVEAMVEAEDVLRMLSDHFFCVGNRVGQGQVMKLVNNLLSGVIMAGTYEALVMGAKAGLDPDVMVDVLNASSARNSATLEKVPQSILTGTFDFGASIRTITKDVRLGLQEADAQSVPMWASEAAGRLWRLAEISMDPEADYTSLIRLIEGFSGVEVRSRSTLRGN